jgi:hypothetical protein
MKEKTIDVNKIMQELDKMICKCHCHRKDWVGGKCTGCIMDGYRH